MRRWPLRAVLAAVLGCVLAATLSVLVATAATSTPEPVNAPLFTYGSH
ncbi:hypothetical protein [Amycolatopsis acidicola]|nr:hypothetical protein [Amycolatopsis acidicola]